MELYIGNLPKNADAASLQDLVSDALKTNMFDRLYEKIAKKAELDQVKNFQIVENNAQQQSVRYGHVSIHRDYVGKAAIDSLKGKELSEGPIEVREFMQRSIDNERRLSHIEKESARQIDDRRLIDRRFSNAI